MIAKNRSRKSQVPSAKEDIRKRHDVIRQTQMEYYEKKEKLTQSRLLQELKKKGYAPSIATLNRDLVEVAKGNNFVRNIAESTYSKHIEDMYNSLDTLEEMCWQWIDSPPQILKQKLEPTGEKDKKGKPVFRVIEMTMETISPRMITSDIREIAMAKKDLLTGNALNVSIVLLGNKSTHLQEDIKKAKEFEISQKKSILEKDGRMINLEEVYPSLSE